MNISRFLLYCVFNDSSPAGLCRYQIKDALSPCLYPVYGDQDRQQDCSVSRRPPELNAQCSCLALCCASSGRWRLHAHTALLLIIGDHVPAARVPTSPVFSALYHHRALTHNLLFSPLIISILFHMKIFLLFASWNGYWCWLTALRSSIAQWLWTIQ